MPNERIRDFLKNQLLAESSGEDGSGEDRDGASSPPPNCAICLGKINSKCFTDSCMHQFCFSCLLEWSKVSFLPSLFDGRRVAVLILS